MAGWRALLASTLFAFAVITVVSTGIMLSVLIVEKLLG